MKILFFVIVALFAVAPAISILDLVQADEWRTFKVEHNKKYETEIEDKLRMKIFMENKRKIVQHNHKYKSGNASYRMKINEYADMSHDEFIATFNGFNKTGNNLLRSMKNPVGANYIPPTKAELPLMIDWRERNAVTPVKHQGRCGSCWAFSATGALEAQHFKRHGVLISLSEQNLLDCSGMHGNEGCSGGWMNNAFQYIKDNKGINTAKSYPYEGSEKICRYDPENVGAMVYGFIDIPSGNEDLLKRSVVTVGPISVAIDASDESFQFYHDGIYDEPNCSSAELNHAVLVVGYGTDENRSDYWLVKNSWGTTWGDEGYIQMLRNRGNRCGIASVASYPLV